MKARVFVLEGGKVHIFVDEGTFDEAKNLTGNHSCQTRGPGPAPGAGGRGGDASQRRGPSPRPGGGAA